MTKMSVIAIDFDGTIVEHAYPKLGRPVPYAIEVMKYLEKNHKLILYTMRSDSTLYEAVQYCKENGIIFYGVNENPQQKQWTNSQKIYANFYIDDAAIGCPLIYHESLKRPYVDWLKINEILEFKYLNDPFAFI